MIKRSLVGVDASPRSAAVRLRSPTAAGRRWWCRPRPASRPRRAPCWWRGSRLAKRRAHSRPRCPGRGCRASTVRCNGTRWRTERPADACCCWQPFSMPHCAGRLRSASPRPAAGRHLHPDAQRSLKAPQTEDQESRHNPGQQIAQQRVLDLRLEAHVVDRKLAVQLGRDARADQAGSPVGLRALQPGLDERAADDDGLQPFGLQLLQEFVVGNRLHLRRHHPQIAQRERRHQRQQQQPGMAAAKLMAPAWPRARAG